MVERVEEVEKAVVEEPLSFPRFILNEFKTEESKLRALQKVSSLVLLRKVWGIDDLPNSGIAGAYYDQMAQAVCQGGKLNLSEASERLLGGCRKDITGEENIPKDGPLLIICNHWKGGPLWAMWQSFLISELTNKKRGQEVGFIIQDALEFWRTGRVMPASEYILKMVAEASGLSMVTAPFKLRRGIQEHKAPVSIFKRLKKGEIVGLYPEARKTRELEEAWEGSGTFVSKVAEKVPNTQILPVGVFSEGKKRDLKLSLKFGEPIPASQCDKKNSSEIADGMMAEIASLLPPKYQGEFKIFK